MGARYLWAVEARFKSDIFYYKDRQQIKVKTFSVGSTPTWSANNLTNSLMVKQSIIVLSYYMRCFW